AAESQVANAVQSLDQTVVVAPFAGAVATVLQGVGATVSSSTPILTLASSDVEVDVTVDQDHVGTLMPGQAVQLSLTAYPTVVFPAHVGMVAPVADSTAHTFDVRVVPDQQDARLLAGMSARVATDQDAVRSALRLS